jgi:hypothetical protein
VRKLPLAGVLTVIALAMAACTSSTSTSKTISTATTTSGSSQNVAGDKSLAVAANLRLSDFPAGWTSTPQSSTTTGPHGLVAQLLSCLHTNLSVLNTNSPTRASSSDFSDSSGDTVSSSVNYLTATSDAQAEMSVLTSAQFPSCFATAVNDVLNYEVNNPSSTGTTLPAGVTLGHASFNQMSFPSYGDQTVAYRSTIPISYDGLNPSVYADFVITRKGRALAALLFESTVTPPDSSLEEQLTGIVVGRLVNT